MSRAMLLREQGTHAIADIEPPHLGPYQKPPPSGTPYRQACGNRWIAPYASFRRPGSHVATLTSAHSHQVTRIALQAMSIFEYSYYEMCITSYVLYNIRGRRRICDRALLMKGGTDELTKVDLDAGTTPIRANCSRRVSLKRASPIADRSHLHARQIVIRFPSGS